MKRAMLYLTMGILIGYLLSRYIWTSQGVWADLFYGLAIGVGWAVAFLMDDPNKSLAQKLLFSFLGMLLVVLVGLVFFPFEIAVLSAIRFSTVFVGYYLLASLKGSKSLRNGKQ